MREAAVLLWDERFLPAIVSATSAMPPRGESAVPKCRRSFWVGLLQLEKSCRRCTGRHERGLPQEGECGECCPQMQPYADAALGANPHVAEGAGKVR